jgi:thioredoxin 1
MKKLIGLLLLISNVAFADFVPYSKSAHDMAIKEGKTIVIDFHASWCPTCRKQEPILNEIVNMPEFKNVVGFKADYDKEKDLKKSLKVSKQSTLVVFKGDSEVARSTGATNKKDIQMLIEKGL